MLNSTPPTSGTTENLFETVKQWLTETGSVIEEMDLVDEAAALRPDTGIAVAFLERLRPGGPWVLTAIVPDGRIPRPSQRGRRSEVEAFVCAAQRQAQFVLLGQSDANSADEEGVEGRYRGHRISAGRSRPEAGRDDRSGEGALPRGA